jgi:hypothetical protein
MGNRRRRSGARAFDPTLPSLELIPSQTIGTREVTC